MSGLSFPDDYYTTVEEFTAEFEGATHRAAYPDRDYLECDFCSKGVPYGSNPRVGQYLADRVLESQGPVAEQLRQQRRLVTLATYCEECATRMLLFPCEGFTEVRQFYTLDEDLGISDVEVTDISPADDGIPWDPRELSEKITGLPFDAHAATIGEKFGWGPENMVTVFLSIGSGVDIREMVDYRGNIDPKLLGQARRAYEQMRRERARAGDSRAEKRRHFSKRVREGRGDQ